MARTRIASALADKGGFNAHGTGFRQAARKNDVVPDLVEATSVQIVFLGAYLRQVPKSFRKDSLTRYRE